MEVLDRVVQNMMGKRLLTIAIMAILAVAERGFADDFLTCNLSSPRHNPIEQINSSLSHRENIQRILFSLGGDDLQSFLGFTPKVVIVPSSLPNASIDTAELRITSGLLELTKNESELEFVIAHELGHVLLRHSRPNDFALRSELVEQESEADRIALNLLGGSQSDLENASSILQRAAIFYDRYTQVTADILRSRLILLQKSQPSMAVD